MLPRLEISIATSIDMTYSYGFTFLKSEKVDNITCTLEMCRNMLKDLENIFYVIVTNHNTSLMNYVAKIFFTSYLLVSWYHITKK